MKYTYDQVKKDFEKKGYTLLTKEEEYHSSSQKLKYICPIHGEKEITYSHLKDGRGCYDCGRERTNASHRKDDYVYKELAESKGFEFVRTYIENKKRYVDIICPKHRDKGIQKMQAQNIKRNNGCKYCNNSTLSKNERREIFINRVNDIYGDSLTIEGEYVNQTKKILCTCNIHNETNNVSPIDITNGHNGCSQCRKEKMRMVNMKSNEEFEKQVKEVNPHIKLLEEYKGASGSLKCFCTIHNKEFTKYFGTLISRHTGCEDCYREDIRSRMGKTTEQFKEELKLVHPELEVIGEYTNRYDPIKLYCTIHNYEFESSPCDILKRKSCCPKSVKYIKEKYVGKILDIWGIDYIPQKTFEDCKDINVLSFDFYLQEYNICIEYQGEQHYKPVKFGTQNIDDANKKFEYTKFHDKIKRDYCNEKNIPLIEIPYWEYDDLEYFLFDKLVKHNVIKEEKCA